MKYADGDIYDGEWDKGNIHGQGTMKYSDGDIYEGNWINGEKSVKECLSMKKRPIGFS